MVSEITRGILISCWIVYLAILGAVVVVLMAIANGSIGYMPPVEQLKNPIGKYASQIISSDEKALGACARNKDNRIYVNYKGLSPDLVKALITTEDVRFAKHSGAGTQGLSHAIVERGISMQKSGSGGSTIARQLAKRLFSPSVDDMMEHPFQKLIEWVIAAQLERYYTKKEIMSMYLSKFDFSYNAVGIQSASRVYFGKTPKTLKIEGAATLVGMCRNPSYLNPVRRNKRTIGRRNTVLEQVEKAGYVTKTGCDSLKALPLIVHFTRMDHKDDLAPYFREYLCLTMTTKRPGRKDYASWRSQKFSEDSLSRVTNPLCGWCNENKKADGECRNLYTDGLEIYTSIDSHMQKYAEDAAHEHMSKGLRPAFFREKEGRSYTPFSGDVNVGQIDTMLMRAMHQTDRYRAMKKSRMAEINIRKEFERPADMRVFGQDGPIGTIMSPLDSIRYHKSFLRTAFTSMDPRTGQVKAYVGSIGYNDFQYDMVDGDHRQIGSTMRPFLYSLAMIEGISPCDQVLHVQQQLMDENGRLWVPRDASARRVGEMATIKWGLQNSDDWVTAYLMSQLSPYTFVHLPHFFGLKNRIDPVISVYLDTPDVSVGEMVGAYAVLVNKGIRIEPLFVTRIEDSYGNTVANFTPRMSEVLTEDASYKMLHMLRSVIDGGTKGCVRFRYGIRAETGGKTGATQNDSDGWFMGFTPSLVSGCWVGGKDRSIHFDRLTEGQGMSIALPIYALYTQKVYKDKTLGYSKDGIFKIPEEYANPCSEGGEEDSPTTSPDTGGIDKMFE